MGDEIAQQTLDEIRKLNRFNRYCAGVSLIILLALVGFLAVRMARLSAPKPPAPPSWQEVRQAMDREDLDAALQLALMLQSKNPTNYCGEMYLGAIYQAKGDFLSAEKHYERVCDLFPTEENKKKLSAIKQVLGIPEQ